MKVLQITLVAIALLLPLSSFAAEVSVAVASNFTAPMKAISEKFEKQTGHSVVASFGSSGKFFAQISHGAPYDIFLSADQEKAKALEEKGLAVSESRFTYARGILALWSTQPNPEDRLKSGNFNKLAIANPRLAPYGLAAIETLKAIGSYDPIAPKLVKAENVSQSYQFTYTDNADLGFVALSQITLDGKLNRGYAWIVPASLHDPILQDAVILSRGKDNEAALALVDFLKQKDTQALIASFGYSDEIGD